MKIQSVITLFVSLFLGSSIAFSQTTAFNYQGKLNDGGKPANGNYQLQFKLFNAAADGNQIGGTIPDVDVTVAQGVFSVRLDFGAEVFAGADRFLEIAVRRNASEVYTTISPRQPIAASPYSIRTLSAAQADLALDSQKLGGLDATEYVNASTVNSTFIRNSTLPQTGSFNIDGNGFIGGNLGVGTTNPQSKLSVNANGYGFTQTNGTVTVGTFLTAGSGWIGTRSNHPLNFFTNDSGAQMQIVPTGEVGIGVAPQSGIKLDVGGNGRFQTINGNINLGTPNGEAGMTITGANRADFRFDGSTLKILAGTGTAPPANTNGVAISTSGNVGIGNDSPAAKLDVAGNVRQTLTANGVVKAMIYVNSDGSIARCYNSVINSASGTCGFALTRNIGSWWIDFGFQVDNRFWSGTPGIGVTNIGLQANTVGPNTIAVKLFQTDQPNSTGENIFRNFMLIVY